MKFQLSTKPFAEALALGIVNANVSKFYSKSCIAQLTATRKALKVNVEANLIVSEMRLKGLGDSDDTATVCVDSLLLKQLVHTFEENVTTLEFVEGGLVLHNGKSKFTLPEMSFSDSGYLKAPRVESDTVEAIELDKANWKFIKDHQMYALSMAFIHPVYNRIWIGCTGDVLVCDYDNGLFTHSIGNKFGLTCLISDTILNLLNSLPEGAKLKKVQDSYQVEVVTDSFEMVSEFTPEYEEDIGSYHADIFLNMMEKNTECNATVDTAAINKFMSQADILSKGSEATIFIGVEGGQIYLKDANVDCKIDASCNGNPEFKVELKTAMLKSVLSSYASEKITMCPIYTEGEASGLIVWDDELVTVVSAVE